jgi:hypothetical protein
MVTATMVNPATAFAQLLTDGDSQGMVDFLGGLEDQMFGQILGALPPGQVQGALDLVSQVSETVGKAAEAAKSVAEAIEAFQKLREPDGKKSEKDEPKTGKEGGHEGDTASSEALPKDRARAAVDKFKAEGRKLKDAIAPVAGHAFRGLGHVMSRTAEVVGNTTSSVSHKALEHMREHRAKKAAAQDSGRHKTS